MYKSFILLGSSICLLGVDQSWLRFSRGTGFSLAELLIFFAQFILVSLLLMYIFSWWYRGLLINTIAGFSTIMLAFMTMLSTDYRIGRQNVKAQLLVNGWRLLFLLFFTFFCFVLKYKITVVCLFAIFVAFLLSLRYINIVKIVDKKFFFRDVSVNYPRFYKHAGSMFLLGLTLNFSLYLDQVVLAGFATYNDSAEYFSYSVLIQAPIIFICGFLGFLLAPTFRNIDYNNLNFFLIKWLNFKNYFFFSFVAISLFWLSFFYFLQHGLWRYKFSPVLIIAFTFIAFIRLLYVLPSSVLGVIAESHELKYLFIFNISGIIIQFAIFFSLLKLASWEAVDAMAIGLVFNWIIRISASYGTVTIVRRRLYSISRMKVE